MPKCQEHPPTSARPCGFRAPLSTSYSSSVTKLNPFDNQSALHNAYRSNFLILIISPRTFGVYITPAHCHAGKPAVLVLCLPLPHYLIMDSKQLIQANKDHFDRVAHTGGYDESPFVEQVSRQIAHAITQEYQFDEGSTVMLDYACGTGQYTRWISTQFSQISVNRSNVSSIGTTCT